MEKRQNPCIQQQQFGRVLFGHAPWQLLTNFGQSAENRVINGILPTTTTTKLLYIKVNEGIIT